MASKRSGRDVAESIFASNGLGERDRKIVGEILMFWLSEEEKERPLANDKKRVIMEEVVLGRSDVQNKKGIFSALGMLNAELVN
jgi:hypothetical protein